MTGQKSGLPAAALLIAVLLLWIMIPAVSAESIPDALVIDSDEIQRLFAQYVSENGLDEELISVAYVYTGTGETWYHREDQWYYSASLYKVPLMMILAEREANGELKQDSLINGMTLADVEQTVLVDSNNDVAYSTMLSIAQPDVCRGMFCRYSDLPEEYYNWDFYGGSYFTARFMSDVMTTLYRDPARFPQLVTLMKQAQPGHYFRLRLGDQLEIAQKYGNYHDENERDWNHTTGIVFTPTPFILTVMTRYGGISETVISDLAVLFRDYTLKADERLKSLQQAETISDVTPVQELSHEFRDTEPIDIDQEQNGETVAATNPEKLSEDAERKTSETESSSIRLAVLAVSAGLTVMLTGILISRKKNR